MRYCFITAFIFFAAISSAEESVLDDVTVTPAENPDLAGSMYFSRTDIEGRFFSLSDFLARINGIQIQQLSGVGNPALLSIRGASGQHTRVVVDGVEESNAQYGSYDINRIPVSQIESIEIVRDGVTRGQNDDAIGGTVYITTRKQSADNSLSIQAGSYGTVSASASTSLTDHIGIQLEHLQSENDYRYNVPAPATNSLVRNQDEDLNNAAFRRNSIQLTAMYGDLHGRVRYNHQNKDIPDYFRNNNNNNAELKSQTTEFEIGGQHTSTAGESSWQLNSQKTYEEYSDPSGLIGLGEDNDRYRYDHNQLMLVQQKTFSQWMLKGQFNGAEQNYRSRYLNDSDSSECLTPEGNCDAYSYQRELHYLLQAGWYNAQQTLSTDMSLSRREISGLSRPQSSSGQDTFSDSVNGASVALRFKNDDLLWSATFKRASRAPSLYERYGDHGLFLSNEDIQTETSNTLSLGLKWQLFSSTLLEATMFQRRLKHALVPVYDSRGIGRYENISEAQLSGLEWQASWCGDYFYTDLSGSHYDSKVDSEVASFDGKKIAGTYHTTLIWTAGISHSSQQFQLSAEYSDDLYIDRSNLNPGETRALISADYRYRFHSADTGIRITNLTNNQFLDYTNRPTTGREWLLYLTKKF